MLIESAPTPPPDRPWRYWFSDGWWGDQGNYPHCVAYAWAHYLEDGPVAQGGIAPCVDPRSLYMLAQTIDGIPGRHDGTTVRAGAKVLQQQGFVQSYRWASDIQDVIDCVMRVGPVVMGTNWYSGMMQPSRPTYTITASGMLEGGHAYVIDGVSVIRKLFRIKNSWGKEWGKRGYAYIDFDNMAALLQADGEACIATEIRK